MRPTDGLYARPLPIKSRPYLLARQAAINLGEGEVHLWLRSSSCFDRVSVIIETRNHVFAYFALYSDVLEPRAGGR